MKTFFHSTVALALALATLPAWMEGCASARDDLEYTACDPGVTRACACGEQTASRRCRSDGTGFAACECGIAASGAGGACNASAGGSCQAAAPVIVAAPRCAIKVSCDAPPPGTILPVLSALNMGEVTGLPVGGAGGAEGSLLPVGSGGVGGSAGSGAGAAGTAGAGGAVDETFGCAPKLAIQLKKIIVHDVKRKRAFLGVVGRSYNSSLFCSAYGAGLGVQPKPQVIPADYFGEDVRKNTAYPPGETSIQLPYLWSDPAKNNAPQRTNSNLYLGYSCGALKIPQTSFVSQVFQVALPIITTFTGPFQNLIQTAATALVGQDPTNIESFPLFTGEQVMDVAQQFNVVKQGGGAWCARHVVLGGDYDIELCYEAWGCATEDTPAPVPATATAVP